MDIGARIKEVRMSKDLSTYELAQIIGVSQSAISKLENGKRKVDHVILEKLSEALNVSVDRLTGESVSIIIEKRLNELNMSLDEVSEKSGVPLYWLQNLDTFIPGQWGDYEIGYDWITKVAEAIDLPASKLRSALARQEVPVYEGPTLTAEEAFNQAREDFKEPLNDEIIKTTISRTEHEHIVKYRYVDEKGKHTVDTVLEMEYNRCKSANGANVIPIPQEDQDHLKVRAAHNDNASNPEQQQLMNEDMMDMEDNW